MSSLVKIRAERDQMSAIERRIADFILENAHLLRDYSSQQLANSLRISQSSVVKFSQKLGFKGYPDLKVSVSEAVARENGNGESRAAPPSRTDPQAALASTERLLRLARQAGKRVHVLHVSTGEEMALLALHKDIASVEVTPQHLTLATPDAYEVLGTKAQMNPPLRDRYHRELLWWGLERGVVDVLGSDHAPHTLDEKSKSYPATPSGTVLAEVQPGYRLGDRVLRHAQVVVAQ
jgi:hypothetical protein